MGDLPPDTARLIIPSDPNRITEVDEFLEEVLEHHNVPETIVTDLAIVTTELVNNAIHHGNGQDITKNVTLIVHVADGEVEIRVSDQGDGPPFDPDSLPDPLAEENLLKEVGRGVFIVRSLMDEVVFQTLPSGGTEVIVRKSLTTE